MQKKTVFIQCGMHILYIGTEQLQQNVTRKHIDHIL